MINEGFNSFIGEYFTTSSHFLKEFSSFVSDTKSSSQRNSRDILTASRISDDFPLFEDYLKNEEDISSKRDIYEVFVIARKIFFLNFTENKKLLRTISSQPVSFIPCYYYYYYLGIFILM